MSLIFDALTTQRNQEPAAARPTQARASGSARPWRALGLAALLGVALAAALAWAYRAGESAGRRRDGAPAARSGSTVAAAAGPAAISVRLPATASVPAAMLASAGVSMSSPASAAVSDSVPDPRAMPAAPTTLSRGAPVAAHGGMHAAPPLMSSEAVALDVPAEFAAFLSQAQAADWHAARQTMERVVLALGSEHVMSLRMQAYLALRQAELDQARGHYQRLIERLPDDREAGLNLALIDWRQGRQDAARQRMARLADQFPNDTGIRAMLLTVQPVQPAVPW